MAAINQEVAVTVEEIAHSAITGILEHIEQAHGLRVDAVSVNWRDITALEGTRREIISIQVTSTSHP